MKMTAKGDTRSLDGRETGREVGLNQWRNAGIVDSAYTVLIRKVWVNGIHAGSQESHDDGRMVISDCCSKRRFTFYILRIQIDFVIPVLLEHGCDDVGMSSKTRPHERRITC